MILIVLAIVCLASVPLTRGSLSHLASLRLRWPWTAPAALALQVLITEIVPGDNHTLLAALHVFSYCLIVAFLLANRAIPGIRLITLGTLSNLAVIIANGGVMAASRRAERLAGLHEGGGFHNTAVQAHPHLLWLGDIIPVPGPLPNVLSPGDCIIFAGMLLLLHRTCHERPGAGRLIHLTPVGAEPAGP